MTDPTLSIRAYDPAADLTAVLEIWHAASLGAHAFLGRDRLADQRRLVETRYLPAAETWVACRGGHPVGFISLLGGFVGGLFVAPAEQGRGVGRALIAHARTIRGELSLEVYNANRGAVRFYRALGFQEVLRKPTDGDGLPFETALLRLGG